MRNADMPAMPRAEAKSHISTLADDSTGLTKREHIAAMAMQGILSDLTASEAVGYSAQRKDVARQSVEMADALLEELEKTE